MTYYEVVYLGGSHAGEARRFCYDPGLDESVYQKTAGSLSLLDNILYTAIQQAFAGGDYTKLPVELADRNLQGRTWNIQAGYANRRLLAGGIAHIAAISLA